MGRITKSSGNEIKQLPSGTHLANCVSVICIGTHHNKLYDKDSEKVIIQFEIPQERYKGEDKDGEPVDVPRLIFKEYTNSIHEKSNLCKDLESWRGKEFTEKERAGFDLFKLAGIPCQLSLIHNEAGYAKIASIIPLAKGTPKLKIETDIVKFDVEEFSDKEFDKLPEWIQNKIKESKEYSDMHGGHVDAIDGPSDSNPESPLAEEEELAF